MLGELRILAALVALALTLDSVMPCTPPARAAASDAAAGMWAACTCPFHQGGPPHAATGLQQPVILAEAVAGLPALPHAWFVVHLVPLVPEPIVSALDPPPRSSAFRV